MAKRIVMEFARGGKITATMLEKEAPKTCDVIWSALPVEGEPIHAMWAGEEIFFQPWPATEEIQIENATGAIDPGTLAIYAPAKSFCVFYGRGIPRAAVDVDIEVNVFAKVDDVPAMAAIGKRIRMEGKEKVRITRG